MSPQSRLSKSAFLLAGAVLLLVGLLAGACDQMIGSSPKEVGGPSDVDGAALSYSHMPAGTTLPSPGEVPLKNGIIGSEEKAPRPKSDSSGEDSPYGCYLASDVSSDSASSRSIYLYFPEEIVEAAGTETKRTVYQVGKSAQNEWVRYASCVIPDASGARSLAQEQIVQAGEKKALQETISDSSGTGAAKGGPTSKSCITFQKVELDYCVGGPCCSETYCSYDVSYVTVCGGGGDGGGGGSEDPYPGGGGGGSDPPGGGDGENCQQRLPEPGSGCEPTDPCESDDPPVYCAWGVNDDEVCSNDPLKDMDIRATCAGVEGGRFGGRGGAHEGLDLLAEVGTELYAMNGGDVEAVNNDPDGWGDYVVIKSEGEDRFFLYAHLRTTDVEEGGSVDEGDLIGETGASGNACDTSCSCGPSHVHLEVREGDSQWYNADPQDPEDYIGADFDSTSTPISDECGN